MPVEPNAAERWRKSPDDRQQLFPANSPPEPEPTEQRLEQVIAKVHSDFSATHTAMRYWQESIWLFAASIALTIVAVYLSQAYEKQTDIQRIRIFVMAIACTLAWASKRRAKRGFEAGVEHGYDVFFLAINRIWSFGYAVWFGAVVALRVIRTFKPDS